MKILYDLLLRKILLLLVFAIPNFIKAQITFYKNYGGSNTETAYRVEICEDKGYIAAGYTRSMGSGSASMYLFRTNKYGELIWEKAYGGHGVDRAYAVAVTPGGSFVAVGTTTSSGQGQEDIYVVKVDKDGNKVWEKTFGGSGSEEGWDIRYTNDGGFIITGSTNSWGAGFFDAFLLKIDADGNEQWRKLYGGGSFDAGFCVRQTSDGGYAVLGQTHSYGPGDGSFYFFKTDSEGNLLWEQTYGGAATDEGRYFQLTNDGGYILVGKTESKGAGDEDVYAIKVDAEGNLQWEKTYGGDKKDTGKSIEPTHDGGYIITSSSRSFNWQVPWIWIIKTDANGETQWTQRYGDWNHDHGHHILPTDDGGYIATGHNFLNDNRREDVYLLKLDSKGEWNPQAKDAAISIVSPAHEDCAREVQKIQVYVINYGNADITEIPVTVNINGDINQQISQTFNQTIKPGGHAILTFDQTINTTGGINATIDAHVNVNGDVYADNNYASKSVNIRSSPAPEIALGENITTESPVQLDAGAGFEAYKWSTNETTQIITVNNTGKYWVRVTDYNGCRASDTIIVNFVSIHENAFAQSLKVFPNPNGGEFNISFNSQGSSPVNIDVYNITGTLILNESVNAVNGESSIKLNLKQISSGIYLIRIRQDQNIGTARVMIR
jgi:hypothetical protein